MDCLFVVEQLNKMTQQVKMSKLGSVGVTNVARIFFENPPILT